MGSAARAIDPAKVALYIRWSTEDQGEGTTLEVQLEGCSHFVKSQGWVVDENLIFVDDGYSGGTLDRPALTRLRRLVKEGKVDCVVVFKLDRLSRNVVDTVNLVLREWENRCYLKSARESIDTYDHAGKMFFYTLVSFAEWERNTIRDRTFSGRVRRAQEGRNPGRKLPFGYATGEKRGEVRVVPAEASVVQRIFREYIAGASVRAIAFKLNEEGIPGPRQGGWAGPTVARMLSNETYTGKLIFGAVTRMPKERPEGTPAVVANEQPLVIREGALPAIISPEEFALAQAVKRERPNPGRGDGSGRAMASSYLLSGLLVCGLCGGTMRVRPPYDRKHALYFCITRFHLGPSACDSSYIRQPDLDAEVVRHLKARYGSAEHRLQHIREYLAQVDGEVVAVEGALRKVQEQLAGLAEEEAHVRKHFRQQAITLEEYRQMVDDLRGEEAELKGKEKALSTRLSDLRATAGGQAYLLDAARRIDQWEQLDPMEQKNVLRFFVQEVRTFKRPRSSEVSCKMVWKIKEC
ncbi:MAG: recombinase family protein [Bacillota bacterium]